MTQEPTATITIKVFPTGRPGLVLTTMEIGGPAQLTNEEVVRVLRQAIENVEQAS